MRLAQGHNAVNLYSGSLPNGVVACADPEGGGGGGGGGAGGSDSLPSPEKSQNIGFLSHSGQDPLKNYKTTEPAFNVGSLSFRWRAEDGPLIVVF